MEDVSPEEFEEYRLQAPAEVDGLCGDEEAMMALLDPAPIADLLADNPLVKAALEGAGLDLDRVARDADRVR